MRPMTIKTLDRALDYAARGWSAFPLAPGTTKPFKGTHGFCDATTDPATIRQAWADHPDADVGIGTGAASGEFVLDVDTNDGKRGVDSLREFVERNGPLPPPSP